MYQTTEYTSHWTRTSFGDIVYDCRDTGDYIITYRVASDGTTYAVQFIIIEELIEAVNRINI